MRASRPLLEQAQCASDRPQPDEQQQGERRNIHGSGSLGGAVGLMVRSLSTPPSDGPGLVGSRSTSQGLIGQGGKEWISRPDEVCLPGCAEPDKEELGR